MVGTHFTRGLSALAALLALSLLGGCTWLRGELLPAPTTLQPIEVTRFLGAAPPPQFLFRDWNDQGYPEYVFEVDGSVMVGIPAHENGPAFLIDKFEVTNSQYRRFCESTGRVYPKDPANPAWRHYYFLPRPNHPVDRVNWFDANEYALWTGKSLPTAAEWRRAATHGGTPLWQDAPPGALVANTLEGRRGGPEKTGMFPADESPSGVRDLAGNIDEWVLDESYGVNRRVMGGYWGSSRQELPTLVDAGISDDASAAQHGFRTVFRLPRLETENAVNQ